MRSRLPRGMYQHPKGRSLYARIQRGGHDVRINLGTDLAIARQRLREIREHGLPQVTNGVTVADVAQRWLDTRVRVSRIPSGQQQMKSYVERFIRPVIGHYRLRDVTPEILLGLRIVVEAQAKTPCTARHILRTVKSVFLFAVENGLLDRSPVPRSYLPRLPEKILQPFTDAELATLYAMPEPYSRIVRLAVASGARWQELRNMRPEHILSNGAIQIESGKVGRVRNVPLPLDLASELRACKGPLVPFVSSGSFNKTVRRLSGINRFFVRNCRDTLTCHNLEAGISLAVQKELLGHTSYRQLVVYGRASNDVVMRECQRIWDTKKKAR